MSVNFPNSPIPAQKQPENIGDKAQASDSVKIKDLAQKNLSVDTFHKHETLNSRAKKRSTKTSEVDLIKSVSENKLTKLKTQIDRTSINLQRVLAEALISKNYEAAKLILLKDPSLLNQADDQGSTPLMIAAIEGSQEAIEFLLKQDEILSDKQDLSNALILSLKSPNIVKLLIAHDKTLINRPLSDGKTAVDFAALGGYTETLALLLDNGGKASENWKSKTPFVYLKTFRPKNFEATLELLKSYEETASKTLKLSKDIKSFKYMSHAFHLDKTIVTGNYEIKGSGFFSAGMAHQISKSFKLFTELYPNTLSKDMAGKINDAYEMVSRQNSESIDYYSDKIKNNLPIQLSAGYGDQEGEGHATSLMILGEGNYRTVVLCNRGGGNRRPLEVYKLKTSEITDAFLLKWKNSYQEPIENYLTLVEELSSLAEPQGPDEKEFEIRANLPNQTVGNCSFASLEGSMKAYLYYLIKSDNPEYSLDIVEEVVNSSFNKWVVLHRIVRLEKYTSGDFEPNMVIEALSSLWNLEHSLMEMPPELSSRLSEVENAYVSKLSYFERVKYNANKLWLKSTTTTGKLYNYQGRSELTEAINNGYLLQVGRLLRSGHGIETRDKNGDTPLSMAVHLDRKDIAKFLLDAGASFVAKDLKNYSPLDYALNYKRDAIIGMILEKQISTATPMQKEGLLSMSMTYHYAKGVADLIAQGVDPKTTDQNGDTVPIYAIKNNQLEIINAIIQKNSATDTQMQLRAAIQYSKPEVFKLLFESSPENFKEIYLYLDLAIRSNNSEIVDYLNGKLSI